jgi:hypothetical protein
LGGFGRLLCFREISTLHQVNLTPFYFLSESKTLLVGAATAGLFSAGQIIQVQADYAFEISRWRAVGRCGSPSVSTEGPLFILASRRAAPLPWGKDWKPLE